MNPPRPRAAVEPPDNSWGSVRLLYAHLLSLGYSVEQHVINGRSLLVIKS